jgi:signal transduction histidine kinase
VKPNKKKFKKFIRDLVVGETNYIESRGLFKRVMLSGQMALMALAAFVVYISMDLALGSYSTVPVYLIASALAATSIYLNRKGKHCTANYFLLPTLNITIYLLASSGSYRTGSFVFFIICSIASFAMFDYRHRLEAILFAIFTYVLFVLAYFVDFSLLPERRYSESTELLIIIINFTVALPAAVMVIYLLISINYYNDMQLNESNRLLMKANHELDRFVYSTSHDLRAPLTSVMGLINIAEQANNPQESRMYFSMMRSRLESLDKFIKDITDYSRNNRMHIGKENVNLTSLINEVWESVEYSPGAENIRFQMEVPDGMEVFTDRNRLSIILSNLISNAIRYHDQGKQERYIRLRVSLNGYGFYIKVEDNGQGISPEYHNKVFDMFYRANEQSKGSGLGLYIVKETLHKLSGSIHLESSPGVGSTFTIRLPYN